MDRTVAERTANSLNENCHNFGEALYAIYRDGFLFEYDPVVCLVSVS